MLAPDVVATFVPSVRPPPAAAAQLGIVALVAKVNTSPAGVPGFAHRLIVSVPSA